MSKPAATFERLDRIGVITLDRPEKLNAVNGEMATIIGEALDEIDRDPDCWAAVITGRGRAFCVGADLKAVAAGETVVPPGREQWGFAGIVRHTLSKPIIAAVNGMAYGGGMEIALACDLIVAAETATFGLPEVKRGLIAAAGGMVRLPCQLPLKVAVHLALTGEPMDATRAERWGLVNAVVPGDNVLDRGLELAALICRNAPLAVQASKRVLYRIVDGTVPDEDAAWAVNRDEARRLYRTLDAAEGPRAFAEKRLPVWQGR